MRRSMRFKRGHQAAVTTAVLAASLWLIPVAPMLLAADPGMGPRARWQQLLHERLPGPEEHEAIARLAAGSLAKPVDCPGLQHERTVFERLVSADAPQQEEFLRSLDIQRQENPDGRWLPVMRLVWIRQLATRGEGSRQLVIFAPVPHTAGASHATIAILDKGSRVLDWRPLTKGWNFVDANAKSTAEETTWVLRFDSSDGLGGWVVAFRIADDRLRFLRDHSETDWRTLRTLEESLQLQIHTTRQSPP